MNSELSDEGVRRVIVSLEEYQAVLELNQTLRQLCARAADALEADFVPWNHYEELVKELRKGAE